MLVVALLGHLFFFLLEFLNNFFKKIHIMAKMGQLLLNTIWKEALLILADWSPHRFILVQKFSKGFFDD